MPIFKFLRRLFCMKENCDAITAHIYNQSICKKLHTWFCFAFSAKLAKSCAFSASNKMEEERYFSFCDALKNKYCPDSLDDHFENIEISAKRRGR